MFVALAVSALILFTVLYAVRLRAKKIPGMKAPGPSPLPIIGSAHLLRGPGSPFVKFTELANLYGEVYAITLGSTKCVVVSSVRVIRSVLMQNGKFFGGRPDFIRFHKLFADDRQNSLALCDWGNLQVKRRNIARRHCDPKHHSPLNQVISDVGTVEMKEMISTLHLKSAESRALGQDLNIKPIVLGTCLNILSQYMCSTRFDLQDAEFQEVVRTFDEIFWEINQGYAVDFIPWLEPVYGGHMRKLSKWSQLIRNFILKRIISQRELHLDDDETEKDFTDALLKTLRKETMFTRDAIIFILEDFLGGASAIGNMIMLMLGLIVRHPETAVKIQEEVDALTGGLRTVNVADSEQLPYLMATINETLRFTSSPIVPHVATEDTLIEGYAVEKGTVIMINNYKINRDVELWGEPMKFQPEKFLNKTYVEVKLERRGSENDSGVESENESQDNEKKHINGTETTTIDTAEDGTTTIKKEVVTLKKNMPHFMPFSIGKRTCLGKGLLVKYSMVTVATLLQNFNITSVRPELIKNLDACVALPPDTYGLTLTPRKNSHQSS